MYTIYQNIPPYTHIDLHTITYLFLNLLSLL